MFIGCVIEESLNAPNVMADLSPIAERIANMPDDPDARVWHVRWYRLSEPELLRRLDRLAAAMLPHWYAHFWCGDDLYVVLAGRTFRLSIADRSGWEAMVAYGDRVGVERRWTERIPTTLPDWVREALAGKVMQL